MTVGRAAARGNAGLSSAVTLSNQYTTVAAGVPVMPTPAFLTTRTLADQIAPSTNGRALGHRSDIQSPKVHQVSFGIQRELPWASAVEARYVGTFGRDIWRGTDFNQMKSARTFRPTSTARARTGTLRSRRSGVQPGVQPGGPGSEPLTVLPNFGTASSPTARWSATSRQIRSPALADFYMTSRVPGALATFLQNPAIYASQELSNGGFSNYNSLQLELRRQYRSGFLGQINYTLSHTRTDSAGTAQNRFEAFMDNFRPRAQHRPVGVPRDARHQRQRDLRAAVRTRPEWLHSNGLVDALVGGWQVARSSPGRADRRSASTRAAATFNRAGRSNCAIRSAATRRSAHSRSTRSRASLASQAATKSTGSIRRWSTPRPAGVGADNLANAAGFPGQVFFNPTAGDVGNLPILAFDGPSQFRSTSRCRSASG